MSTVREFVAGAAHEVGLEEFELRQKKGVTVRLSAWDVQVLMNIANSLKMNRTQCAQKLLEAAIDEAAAVLGLSELDFSEKGLVQDMESQPDESE